MAVHGESIEVVIVSHRCRDRLKRVFQTMCSIAVPVDNGNSDVRTSGILQILSPSYSDGVIVKEYHFIEDDLPMFLTQPSRSVPPKSSMTRTNSG